MTTPRCVCTLEMVPHDTAKTLHRCPNCDTLQPQELDRKPRTSTPWDKKFHIAWEGLKRTYYPETR